MASRKTYTCFVCQKLGFDVQVYLDGKDEAGNTIRKNVDMSEHYHMTTKQQTQQQQSQKQRVRSTTANVDLLVLETTLQSYFDTINAKLDRAIALLEEGPTK